MRFNKFASFAFLIAAFALVASGCGPKTVPVFGKVVVDGVPASDIRVVFQSAATSMEVPPIATGLTDKNGEYKLGLSHPKKSGAVPGPYVVFLTWSDPDAPENPIEGETIAKESPYNLPPRANSGELKFDVPEKGTKEANFEFDSSKESFAPIGV